MTAATSEQQQQSTRDAIFYAIGFGISSSLLVVINKWTLKVNDAPTFSSLPTPPPFLVYGLPITHTQHFPFGATLTAIQFAVSALAAFLIGVLGISEVDPLDKAKALSFMPAVCMFYISVCSSSFLDSLFGFCFCVCR